MNGQRLTIERFDSLSRVHPSTVRNHFGSWAAALDKAEISETIAPNIKCFLAKKSSRPSEKFRREPWDARSHEMSLLPDLAPMAESMIGGLENGRSFWLGLGLNRSSRRYTDDECFENILALWTSLWQAASLSRT